MTTIPKQKGTARLEAVPEPPLEDGPILVKTVTVGVCGTDIDILNGLYGSAPKGRDRLVLGHECLGKVIEAPADSGFAPEQWVVPIVRRPDPVPCANCKVDEWDMCLNGRYTERGIKDRDGYGSQRFRIRPKFLVPVDPKLSRVGVLTEPASVVVKAWDHIERIGKRTNWEPSRVLVTGAGPIGLLACLIGRQKGYRVHVLDRVSGGPKPELVEAMGATYHAGTPRDACPQADVVLECTGAPALVFEAMGLIAPDGILCLTGMSSGNHKLTIDAGLIDRRMVLENGVVFGTVNANRAHYQAAVAALARADLRWLEKMITRRVSLESWPEALVRQPSDIKPVIDFP